MVTDERIRAMFRGFSEQEIPSTLWYRMYQALNRDLSVDQRGMVRDYLARYMRANADKESTLTMTFSDGYTASYYMGSSYSFCNCPEFLTRNLSCKDRKSTRLNSSH